MKFSFQLFKKLAPSIKNPQEFVERFSLHAFEVEGVKGDTIEIKIPANRWSDAASHWGIAKLASAISGGSAANARLKLAALGAAKRNPAQFSARVDDQKLCSRYAALYAEVPRIGESPQWIKETLWACGLKPINAVVDIMNYTMLEVGQPLHVFDFEKVANGKWQSANRKAGKKTFQLQTSNLQPLIIVRNAVRGEKIETLDGQSFTVEPSDLVIADSRGPLALAGVKGGKRAEVDSATKRIIVESANFDAVSIYRTSKRLNLTTDASLRFSHGLSPALAEIGIARVAQLLKEICGAKIGEWADVRKAARPAKTVLKFDAGDFNRLVGLNLNESACLGLLKRLGFSIKGKLVSPPPERTDISIPEDLFEEVVNLYGYENVPATPPRVHLGPAHVDEAVQFKREVRELLAKFGFDEAYNYSFVSRPQAEAVKVLGHEPVALENPIAEDKSYLRPSLAPRMLENVRDNLRFYDSVRIFEIGNVFWQNKGRVEERFMLGIVLAGKRENCFFELKGAVEEFLREIGIPDPFLPPVALDLPYLKSGEVVRIETDHRALGYLGSIRGERGAIAELDLQEVMKQVSAENAYRPLPKYPAITRDLSLLVEKDARIGEMIQTMEDADVRHLENVELIDEYEDERLGKEKQSITFRLIFRAEDRTLTDHEVGQELEKIVAALKEKFDAEVR